MDNNHHLLSMSYQDIFIFHSSVFPFYKAFLLWMVWRMIHPPHHHQLLKWAFVCHNVSVKILYVLDSSFGWVLHLGLFEMFLPIHVFAWFWMVSVCTRVSLMCLLVVVLVLCEYYCFYIHGYTLDNIYYPNLKCVSPFCWLLL